MEKKIKCLFLDYIKSDKAANNRLNLTIKGFEDNQFEVKCISIVDQGYMSVFRVFSKILFFFKELKKMRKGDLLYLYGEIHLPFLIIFAKRRGLIVLHERTEYPVFYLYPSKTFRSVLFENLYKKCLKRIDVFVTCSYVLENYYKKYTDPKVKFIVIPFLVDLSKFCLKDSVRKENIITYCGYMGGGKDNLEDMIRIFYGDAYLYNNYRLVLIGDAEKDEFDKIKAFAKRVDLCKKIEFTGRLEHQEVIEYLMKSTIHILVRSDVDKNKGGFPSKLAEYLATAIPSIITNVGEVSLYLEDTNNIFFVEKNNNQLFTSKLVNVLKNKELLKNVGKRGRFFVEYYTPKNQIGCLIKKIMIQ